MHPGERMDGTADMDIMDETSDTLSVVAPEQLGSERIPLTPRGYQLEMLEASMKQNIIVAVCPTAPQLTAELIFKSLDGYREWEDSYVRHVKMPNKMSVGLMETEPFCA